MKKLIEFNEPLNKAIQEYADLYCNGNFTMAVRQLTSARLASVLVGCYKDI